MKKIIILLITAILLTGCNATYDINFKKENISDNIKIYTDSKIVNNASQNQITEFKDKLNEWERGYEYYNREIYATDKITGYNYTYDFTYEEYDAMSQIRKCYKDFEFNVDNNYITITTSNEFLCNTYYKDVNNFTLTITSEYKILTSNADTKENNVHKWNFNKNNSKNKPLTIKIEKTKPLINNEKKSNISITKILSVILFILIIVVLLIRKKDQKQR